MRRGATLLFLLCPALVWGQSLADVAQKEKERRKKNEEAGVKPKVVTEADLKAGKGELANDPDELGVSEPASSPPPGGGPRLESSPGMSEEVRRQADEASWRSRKARAVAKLDAAKQKYETLSQMWLAPIGEYYADKSGKPVISSVQQLQEMTARAKAEMEAAQKALDDLEAEAHRAGVPPGWLR